MQKATKWFVMSALAASGVFAFACGGGSSDTNPNTTPSATATPSATETATATATASVTASATVAPPAPPPPIVVAAMKMTGPKIKNPVELKDDGTVMGGGKVVAKFVGAELQDASGKTLVAVAADGTLTMTGAQNTPKFNDKDELEIPGGAKMIIGDDGSVKLMNPDGKADKDSGKMKFTGFKPTARRAAMVLVLGMLMPSSSGPTVTPAAASASASPKH